MLPVRTLLLSTILLLGVILAPILPVQPVPEPETPALLAITGPSEPQPAPEHYFQYLPEVGAEQPFVARNVILLIGDGMGLEHVKAGGMYLHGAAGTLPFEQFPLHTQMTTYSASDAITDSAAAATAMATGQKVNNSVISIALPGSGEELYTLLEYARDRGLATGLVTTTPMTNATPAGFGAHTDRRDNQADIASDYMNQTRPNVLFGGGYPALTLDTAQEHGYTVVSDRAGLLGLDTEAQAYVSGQFGGSYLPYEADGLGGLPHLSEMAATALRILDNDPDGFFLMVEGGRIDTASHSNDITRTLGEIAEFAQTTQMVADWAQAHPDTLIIVLADHETGGLQVVQNNGAGAIPAVTWSTTWHTSSNVGVWTSGNGLAGLPQQLDNTQIFRLVTGKPLE